MLIGGSLEGRLSHARDFRARLFFTPRIYILIQLVSAGRRARLPVKKTFLVLQRRDASFVAPLLFHREFVRYNWDVNGLRLRSEEVSNIVLEFSILVDSISFQRVRSL